LRAVAVGLVIAAVATVEPAQAFDVTSCGQTVPASETGTLRADLVCDASLEAAVNVGSAGKLSLDGHSITGAKIGVACHGRCRVSGPGEIVSPLFAGVSQRGTKGAARAPVRIEHLSIHDAPGNGVGVQLVGGSFLLEDLTLERNAVGICCSGSFQGEHLVLRDNREKGVEAWYIRMRDFSVEGSPVGIYTFPFNFIRRQVPVLIDGSLSGNDVDVRSLNRPILQNVSCEHSERFDGTPWGVCSGD
jgi:hypothetical protein